MMMMGRGIGKEMGMGITMMIIEDLTFIVFVADKQPFLPEAFNHCPHHLHLSRLDGIDQGGIAITVRQVWITIGVACEKLNHICLLCYTSMSQGCPTSRILHIYL